MGKRLVALLVALAALNQVQAAIQVISGIGNFDTNLGTLESVELEFAEITGSTTTSGSHQHTFNPSQYFVTSPATSLSPGQTIDFYGIIASSVTNGGTTVQLDPIATSFGSLVIPEFTLDDAGAHTHSVDFSPVVVQGNGTIDLVSRVSNAVGDHSHSFTIPTFTATYSGAELDPFINDVLSSAVDPDAVTIANSFHAHVISSGNYTAFVSGVGNIPVFLNGTTSTFNASGDHTLDIAEFNVVSTTFTYTPVPEPSTFALLTGILALGFGFIRHQH